MPETARPLGDGWNVCGVVGLVRLAEPDPKCGLAGRFQLSTHYDRITFEANAIGGTLFVDGEPISSYSALDGGAGKQFPFYHGEDVAREDWIGYEVVSYYDGQIFYAHTKNGAYDLARMVAQSWLFDRIAF